MQLIYDNLISVVWLIWLAVWIAGAVRAKPVLRSESLASRLSHFIPLGLGIALLASPRVGGSWLTTRLLTQTVWTFWSGATLVAGGVAFAIWARIHLAGNWSGTITLKQDHSLTRTGPYRLVRHPIYTGILTGILGNAVAQGELRSFVALALIALAFLRKIGIEERLLASEFGDTYARYRVEVPALIPWRWR